MFSLTGKRRHRRGQNVLNLDLVHGLTAQGLYNSHNLVI